MTSLKNRIVKLVRDTRAATMAEYAILVAVIAIVVIVGAKSLGTSVNTRFTNTAGSINNG
jgi:pilus assembly protein Flp/PilA